MTVIVVTAAVLTVSPGFSHTAEKPWVLDWVNFGSLVLGER